MKKLVLLTTVTAGLNLALMSSANGATYGGDATGAVVTVTGAANQTVTLSNGSVVINEQVPTIGGTSGELIVNALHVLTHDTITGQPIADVALGNADAKIDCAAGSSPGENWVSGGGWIVGAGGPGTKATFGFVAGPGGQPTRGHLTLKENRAGQTVHGTVITNFTECLSGQSHFEGTDTNNNTFIVDVHDNGDPGTGDTFQLSATDQSAQPYANGPKFLGGGNIQDHGFLCQ